MPARAAPVTQPRVTVTPVPRATRMPSPTSGIEFVMSSRTISLPELTPSTTTSVRSLLVEISTTPAEMLFSTRVDSTVIGLMMA